MKKRRLIRQDLTVHAPDQMSSVHHPLGSWDSWVEPIAAVAGDSPFPSEFLWEILTALIDSTKRQNYSTLLLLRTEHPARWLLFLEGNVISGRSKCSLCWNRSSLEENTKTLVGLIWDGIDGFDVVSIHFRAGEKGYSHMCSGQRSRVSHPGYRLGLLHERFHEQFEGSRCGKSSLVLRMS